MKPLSSFLPYITPYVVACPDRMVDQAVISTCIDLSDTMLAQDVVPVNTVVGQTDYDVEVPSQQRMLRVMKVMYLDQELTPAARDVVTLAQAWRGGSFASVEVSNGTPREWFVRSLTTPAISVYPPPDTAVVGGLTLVAAYAPTRAATSVDDTFFDDYAEVVAAGAIARIMALPAQPFTDFKVAELYRKSYEESKARISSLSRTGPAAGSLFVRPRAFA